MEILFNELSLTGQFADQGGFITQGLLPFLGVLKEMQDFSIPLLKKSDVWNRMITPHNSLYNILVNNDYRKSDEVRRLKAAMADLTKEPFWDPDTKQDPNSTYFFAGVDIWGSSLSEACERDRITVSFVASPMSSDPLSVSRNGTNVKLLNLTHSKKLTEHLWDNNHIPFEMYLKARFSGTKLDFSKVDPKMGFSSIHSSDQALFIDTFRKFAELTWDQILKDRGLNYKEYDGVISDAYQDIKTYKFRASEKIRCHGYRENHAFVVIGFEVDHKLSDKG